MPLFPVSAIPSASREILVIDNSLRFNDDDSAYLSRTFGTPTDQNKWTWSGWVKRGNLGTEQAIFGQSYVSISEGFLRFKTSNQLEFQQYSAGGVTLVNNLKTTQVFRDTSAWYHVVVLFDSAGSGNDRQQIWVNGQRITSFATEVYSSNNSVWNQARVHYLGRRLSTNKYDGYLAEVNFIDGQALTPSDFGEFGDYGEWNAIEYTGTYGTNGFHLDFKTSGTLGNDANGSNNWTTNNLSATDQMIDTPTNNFPTLNFLDKSGVTLSEGNLKQVKGAGYGGVRASIPFPSTGKWYVEYVENSTAGSNVLGSFTPKGSSYNLGSNGGNQFVYWGINGSYWSFGTGPSTDIGSGSILQMAYDSDTGKTWIGYNNVWRRGSAGSVLSDGNPSAGTNPTGTWADYAEDTFCTIFSYNLNGVMNFGQDSSFAGGKTAQGNQDSNGIGDFYYTPPSGFLALCTKNLPAPTVIPSEHFNTVTYTGDGAVSNAITGVGFQPEFTWIKGRSGATSHGLYDSVRGVQKDLASDTTAAETTQSTGLTSFDSDGFTTEALAKLNTNLATYVAWNWKAGGTAVSNTNGTITSSVSANADAGFSIVSYTGNGGSSATIGHGLSVAPEMVIVKRRDSSGFNWLTGINNNGTYIDLNLNDNSADASAGDGAYFPQAFTSSVFAPNSNGTTPTNATGGTYIAYCLHSVDGYSKVGSYTGNGSADGTFVHTGFRPAYVMTKKTSGTGGWWVQDSERSDSNVVGDYLQAHDSGVEGASSLLYLDMLSNGFKLRSTYDSRNANNSTYIYIAFAESPFKHTNAR